jgi:hypothetical protein
MRLRLKFRYCVAFLTLFLFAYSSALATTVIVIITPSGIVTGSDGKNVASDSGRRKSIGNRSARKVFLVQDRLVLASIGIASASLGAEALYSFPSWAAEVEGKLPENASVKQLAEIVSDESARTFAGFDALIKNGTLKRRHSLEEHFVQYLMVGYDGGVPTVYTVDFQVDWQKKQLIGPTLRRLHPEADDREDFGFYALGSRLAVERIDDPKSKGHRQIAAKNRAEIDLLTSRQDLTLEQATTLVHRIIAVESEMNPKKVGPPISVVTIPKSGPGFVTAF